MKKTKEEQLQFIRKIVDEKVKEQILEEICSDSWEVWICPLAVVKYENNILTLYHEQAAWVAEHYGRKIKRIVNEYTEIETAIDYTNDETM